jgi:O-acetyl-ADP-ribose deacetylase (regulator of RNase III)
MTSITAIQGDITTFSVDAIVNAANPQLAGGGGVDGAIHRTGGPSILEECRGWVSEHGILPTGEAMITGAGDLPARHVIHTVGPIWGRHDRGEAQALLASCYRNSLDLALASDCRSVAFPNISTGVYGFPKDLAAETAVNAVMDWTTGEPSIDEILFVCFDAENLGLYEDLLGS